MITYENIYIAKLLMKSSEDININPEIIENDFLRSVFVLILKAIDDGVEPSILYLTVNGLKPVADVAKLTDYDDPRVTIKKCEEEILKSWKVREIAKTCHNAVKSLNTKKDPEEISEYIDMQLTDIGNNGIEKVETVEEIYKKRIDVYEERYRNRYTESQIMTGIKELDEVLYTNQLGRYVIIGGRPSQGKTSLMLSIALNTSLKHKTAFVSIESSKKEIVDRSTCNLGQINNASLMSGHLKKQDFDKLAIVYGEIKKRQITIIQPKVRTAPAIIAIVKKLIRTGHKIIMLDYIQKIQISGYGIREDIIKVSGDLSALCKRYNVLMYVGAQANRDADNRKPKMSDLKESARIEEDADIAIFPWLQYEEGSMQKIQKAQLVIAKNRDGIRGDVLVNFEPWFYKFY